MLDDAGEDPIAHQDASHAVCNTDSLLDELKRTRRLLWIAIMLLVVLIAAVIAGH